ncbi:hypothetical protein PDQ70_16440 [Bacillus cereus group sp. Bc011]|uniref:hypothetical protein n=1 Tax=unclassified Bacillus cereus group TaxID=2750818 RepID=UPI0022E7EC77|nr:MULTISPECIES: hypothetical protein [unclassified Bacillus cereus group]MDA2681055.1 hypothetical protein [Bacillus cereus group sp. Bc029]MDA2742047.1 hypothetical protein [Bacillus cereus group sp. Bc011]
MIKELEVKKKISAHFKNNCPKLRYESYVNEAMLKELAKELINTFTFEMQPEDENEVLEDDSVIEYSLSLYAITETEFETRLNILKNNLRAALENGSKANHEYASGIQDTLKILGLE